MGFAHISTWGAMGRHGAPYGEKLQIWPFPCRKVTFETKYGLCGTKYGSFLGLRMTPFFGPWLDLARPGATWERPGGWLAGPGSLSNVLVGSWESWESWESRVLAVWRGLARFVRKVTFRVLRWETGSATWDPGFSNNTLIFRMYLG